MLLRLAVTLRDRFKLELQSHQELFLSLKDGLGKSSFLSLWGRSVALYGGGSWALLDPSELPPASSDLIVLRLDPHLQVLSDGFALPHPEEIAQFQLFPAAAVSGDSMTAIARKA